MLPASPLQLLSGCVRYKIIHIPRAAHRLRLARQGTNFCAIHFRRCPGLAHLSLDRGDVFDHKWTSVSQERPFLPQRCWMALTWYKA
jgi:hypothetical protein